MATDPTWSRTECICRGRATSESVWVASAAQILVPLQGALNAPPPGRPSLGWRFDSGLPTRPAAGARKREDPGPPQNDRASRGAAPILASSGRVRRHRLHRGDDRSVLVGWGSWSRACSCLGMDCVVRAEARL
ncbi:hypothetical protein F8280_17585 [Micromonospora noduli]|nr:hypothetical protein F8280_17585 [Micromonospora noduli]